MMPASKPNAILSRRNVIMGCVAAVAAAGAFAAPSIRRRPGSAASARSWWRSQPLNLARGSYRHWTPHRGTDFTLVGETGTVTLRLTHVRPMRSTGRRSPGLRDRAFSVEFALRAGTLPEGDRIYTIRSARQPPMPVYFSQTADKMVAIFG